MTDGKAAPSLREELAALAEVARRQETALCAVEATLFAIDVGGLLDSLPEENQRQHNSAVVMLGVLLGMVNKLLSGPDADLDISIERLAMRS